MMRAAKIDRAADQVQRGRKLNVYVGRRLQQIRSKLGLSQDELSARSGISLLKLRGIEAGLSQSNSGELFLLSKTLGVRVTYFYDDYDATDDYPVEADSSSGDVPSAKDTEQLLRICYTLSPRTRRRFLDLLQVLAGEAE